MKNLKGFSLIEIIVAIAVVSIIAVPVSLAVMEGTRAVFAYQARVLAMGLCNREMGVINSTIRGFSSATFYNYLGYSFDLYRAVGMPYNSMCPSEIALYPHSPTEPNANPLQLALYGGVPTIADIGGVGSSGKQSFGNQWDYFDTDAGAVSSSSTTGTITIKLTTSRASSITISRIDITLIEPASLTLNSIRTSPDFVERSAVRTLTANGSYSAVPFIYFYFYVTSQPISGSNSIALTFVKGTFTNVNFKIRYWFIDDPVGLNAVEKTYNLNV